MHKETEPRGKNKSPQNMQCKPGSIPQLQEFHHVNQQMELINETCKLNK